jgi:gamma-glutamylaminecyclotransferase
MRAGGSLVFVYGTLMRGHVNHGLLAGAEFLGTHRTGRAFRLVSLGPYPGALAGGRTALSGEVYRVSPRTLARLDRLEAVPREYVRRRVDTPWGAAWIYLLTRARRGRALPDGVWTGVG